MDLPIFAVTPRKVVAIPKVATKKLLKMSRAPLGLINFVRVIAIDEPLTWEEAIKG